MSVAEAEAAAQQAAEKAKWHRQHLWAIGLLTRRGENTSHYTRKQIEKNKQNLMNANKAARQARRSLRNTKLKNYLRGNNTMPLLVLNEPLRNAVEDKLLSRVHRTRTRTRPRRRHRR